MLLLTSLLSWWYSDGWKWRAKKLADRIDATVDYFSFELLLKTLFAPFRQISAGRVDGSLEVKMRAMMDLLFSRIIGAVVRTFLLIFGGIVVVVQAIVGILVLVGWAFIPALPVAGIVLAVIGWIPG
jgi:hypothetical protein